MKIVFENLKEKEEFQDHLVDALASLDPGAKEIQKIREFLRNLYHQIKTSETVS